MTCVLSEGLPDTLRNVGQYTRMRLRNGKRLARICEFLIMPSHKSIGFGLKGGVEQWMGPISSAHGVIEW
jgi:hypothetical protein